MAWRMVNDRIPKDILYSVLIDGKKGVGRPYLRFKDVCKRDFMATNISVDNWERLAMDRKLWKRVTSTDTSIRYPNIHSFVYIVCVCVKWDPCGMVWTEQVWPICVTE